MTHRKGTNGIWQCIYSVLLLGRVQLLVGHLRLPSWLPMQGFNCERIALLNSVRLVYISPNSKGCSGSVQAAWTRGQPALRGPSWAGVLDQDDLQRSLPTTAILWFCSSVQNYISQLCKCSIFLARILYSWGTSSAFWCCWVYSERLTIWVQKQGLCWQE